MRASYLAASFLVLAACAVEQPGSLPPGGEVSSGSGQGGGAGVGAGPGGPGATTGTGVDPAAARAFFDTNVAPILDSGAGKMCASCHASQFNQYPGAPHFMGGSPAAYYDSLVADPTLVNAAPGNSKLVTQGLHEGPAFTAPQKEQLIAWLTMEAAIRFNVAISSSASGSTGTGGSVGPTGDEMLKKFGDCMDLDTWTQTGMPTVANQPNSAKSNCFGCHNAGTAANYMSNPQDDAAVADAFSHMKLPAPLTKLVSYEIDPQTGQFSKLVQSYRWRDKGQAPTLHPKYVLDTKYQDSIDEWFSLTLEQCGLGGGPGGRAGGAGGAGGGI